MIENTTLCLFYFPFMFVSFVKKILVDENDSYFAIWIENIKS